MKILKIRFSNINSLKDTHEIDFSSEPLSSAGLFAITGVTGSGKTTILDVITLALYNRIPRVKSISTNEISKSGVILTRNMSEGFAEVIYECTAGTYRSKWSISRARTGKLREYEMEVADSLTGDLLDVARTKVAAMNEELIGLSYEQFVRAIILAQGDFAAFLQSKDDERGKLLEQITGGEIYRMLGKKAFEMNRVHGTELQQKKQEKVNWQERLLNDQEAKELEESLNVVSAKLEKLNKAKERYDTAIKLKGDIKILLGKSEFLLETKNQLELRFVEFKKNQGLQLEKHKGLLPIVDKLKVWKDESDKEKDSRAKLDILSKNTIEIKLKIEELGKQIVVLTKDESGAPMAALNLLEEKISKFDRVIENDEIIYNEKIRVVEELSQGLNLPPLSQDLSAYMSLVNANIEDKKQTIVALEKEFKSDVLNDPEKTLVTYRKALPLLVAILGEDKVIVQHKDNLEQNEKELSVYRIRKKELPDKIKFKTVILENLKLEIGLLRKELENKKLRSSLEEHRKNLVKGEPCPLCGALDHPYSEYGQALSDVSVDKISELEVQQQAEFGKLHSMQEFLSEAGKKEIELQRQNDSYNIHLKELAAKRKVNMASIPKVFQLEDISAGQDLLEKHIEMLEQYIDNSVNIKSLNDINKQITVLQTKQKNIERFRHERSILYEGANFHAEIRMLRDGWSSSQADIRNNKASLKEVSAGHELINKSLEKLKTAILPEIQSLAYRDIPLALENVLSTEKFEQLREESLNIEKLINENNTECKVNVKSQKDLKEKDVKQTLEDLKVEAELNKEKLSESNQKNVNLLATKEQQNQTLVEIKKLNKVIESLMVIGEKWNLLNQYIGDAEGKKFSTFAQSLTLLKLIALANKRLKMLDDRYLLSMPEGEEDKGLVVIDQHMGDVRRSVKSLSGGETFIISLGLALALSDLAAKKVKLKSLFIDEGFGSLDKLTLDQTIDTLEKLQYESGKSIGVISHVEAMQERISTQIKVSKNGQGYSRVEVV